jgi:hypothetical protein
MPNAAFLVGEGLEFNDILTVYPPTIKDVSAKRHFPLWVKILTTSQEEVQDELVEKLDKKEKFPTPLEFLLVNAYQSAEYRQIAVEAFNFFIREPVQFIYDKKLILIGDLEEQLSAAQTLNDLRYLNEENFFDFQNMVRVSMGEKTVERPNPKEDPRVSRIKAKARYRDKIKQKQGLGISLETLIVSISCMGLGINPLNIGELSYAAIGPLLRTYQEKEKFDMDVRSLQAGADKKKVKPKYWIRNE